MLQNTAIKALGIIGALLIGCSAPLPAPTPGPKFIQTDGSNVTPTPSPVPTATPYPTYTPYPTPEPTPDIEAIVNERVKRATEILLSTPTPTIEPTNTLAPTPTPTRTPTPTAAPIVRSVSPPATNTLANILRISSATMSGRTLTLRGKIDGNDYQPTTIQVWQAYDPEPYSETCSTERPVAFVQPGNGSVQYSGQLTPYQWTFCRNGRANRPQTDQVPWLYSQTWSYQLQERRRITDPYIYDFSMTVNLDHERVERLEYGSGVASGWRVIVFSGDKIIANQWLDY